MSKTFADAADRNWTVDITVAAVKRVRAVLDVDLMDVVEDKLLQRLSADPVLLCDILYVLVMPQAEAQGISDEDFGKAMAGDAIDRATAAFLDALVDFFPSRRRTVLRAVATKLQQLEEIGLEMAEKHLASSAMEDQLRAELEALGALSGSTPESSASTPEP